MKEEKRDNKASRKKRQYEDTKLQTAIDKNLELFKQVLHYPLNQDFIIKDLTIEDFERKCSLLYMKGTIDSSKLENNLVPSLKKINQIEMTEAISCWAVVVKQLDFMTVETVETLYKAVDKILFGYAAILIDGCDIAVTVNISKFEHRSIEKPSIENAIKGPMESFVEDVGTNISLIRKIVRNEQLISESIIKGQRTSDAIVLMYIKDIADEEILECVKKRIYDISTDNIQNLEIVEQYIEDRPYSLVPTVLYTERPDRVAAFLQEGHIALLNNSSGGLIVPITFWSLFHTAEDYYQRWPYSNFVRLIRLIAFFLAMLTPSLYIAVTNYHVEMIPTDLLLAIGASREIVPFPAIVEVISMELAFEILREAGIRVPTPIGPTIGIVGALILGQAAVEANIVSPILVIVIAITGLSSFAISEISTNFMIRIGRFVYLAFASFMGLYGIGLCFVVGVAYLVSIESFGVPFFSPYAPHYKSAGDTFYRPQLWTMIFRPFNIQQKNKVRNQQ
ncbi:MAG: GerA spore germination protein [Clostridia bacterium]|nr:GerA spore germination protein [Clostridia bacterium]